METPKLKRVHRLDSLRLDEHWFTDEGFLIDKPIVTSVGIFEYKNPDGTIRKELRLPEHVFDEDSLASYKGKPVIITHDAGRVDKDNVDDKETKTVGTMLTEGFKDADDVRVEIVIHSIDDVKRSGLRELSLGYDLELVEEPGTWEGQKYDAIQTEIRVNHLALVRDARAGDHARLNIDGETNFLEGGKVMTRNHKGAANFVEKIKSPIAAYKARQKRRLDELEEDEFIEGDGAEEIIEALAEQDEPVDALQMVKDRRDRRDAEGDPETPESAMGIIAQQDEDIETLIALVEELQAQADMAITPAEDKSCEDEFEEDEEEVAVPDDGGMEVHIHMDSAKVDRIVSQRLAIARVGDRLNLDGLEKLSTMDAKKAIIKKVKPQVRLDGKTKGYINAAYDIAVAEIGKKDTNYQRKQMAQRNDSKTNFGESKADAARGRMMERINGGTQ